jgi:hypothetical protein
MAEKKPVKRNEDPRLAELLDLRDKTYQIRTRGLTQEQKDRLRSIQCKIFDLIDKINAEYAAKSLADMDSLEKAIKRIEKA